MDNTGGCKSATTKEETEKHMPNNNSHNHDHDYDINNLTAKVIYVR